MNFAAMTDASAHIKTDIDALLSLYILIRHLAGKSLDEVRLHFVKAGQTGPGINVDTGLGRYDHHQEGVNECAARLLWNELPEGVTKEALEHLVQMAGAQDRGSIFPKGICVCVDGETQEIPPYLRTTSLQSELAGMLEEGDTDEQIVSTFFQTFNRIFTLRVKQIQAREDFATSTEWITPNVVYIPESNLQLTGFAFSEAGASAVIFRQVIKGAFGELDGYTFGIIRRDDLTIDLRELEGWEGFGGEKWFYHPDGFLACLGSQKNPSDFMSQVNPQNLAQRFEELTEKPGEKEENR